MLCLFHSPPSLHPSLTVPFIGCSLCLATHVLFLSPPFSVSFHFLRLFCFSSFSLHLPPPLYLWPSTCEFHCTDYLAWFPPPPSIFVLFISIVLLVGGVGCCFSLLFSHRPLLIFLAYFWLRGPPSAYTVIHVRRILVSEKKGGERVAVWPRVVSLSIVQQALPPTPLINSVQMPCCRGS